MLIRKLSEKVGHHPEYITFGELVKGSVQDDVMHKNGEKYTFSDSL